MNETNPSSTALPAQPLRRLQAGRISALLDLESGLLRRVCLGETELVRGIYGAVRDRDWGTVAPRLIGLEVIEARDRFEARFQVTCQHADIDFQWQGTVVCTADGRLEYHFDGAARRDFLRNRIGLCVLHPVAECAGKPCLVKHADGTRTHGRFPALISPHQPFFDLRAITHEAVPGIRVEVRFEGDHFEMEDQRNWTDASFKTYSTPLARPFPVAVKAGTRIRQSVVVNVTAESLPAHQTPAARVVEIHLSEEPPRQRPSLGVEWIPGPNFAPPELAALRELTLDHLRVELRPDTSDWRHHLKAMRVVATELPGIQWHAAVFMEDASARELAMLAGELATAPRLNVSLFLILPTTGKVTPSAAIDAARRCFGPWFPEAAFAAGTDAYCAELNRERPEPDRPALPCFSINPQVHAFDDLSLMETLAAQPDAVETVVSFTGKPVVISPITLLPRFNPNATSPAGGSVTRHADPRQSTAFCAAWTLGSLARLGTHDSVHSLTYFELAGPRGLFRHRPDNGTAGAAVERFPVFHLLSKLAGFTQFAPTEVSRPGCVAALRCLTPDQRERLLLANLTADEQVVRLRRADGRPAVATPDSAARGIGGEWTLGAYAHVALQLTN
jgi:D-apionolactonase